MAFYVVTIGLVAVVSVITHLIVAGLKEQDKKAQEKRKLEKADPFRVENWLP